MEAVERTRALLESNRRVSILALRREFELDTSSIEDLIEELVVVQRIAFREGDVLVYKPSTPGTDQAAAVSERRQLTVMFCDLVGSTQLAEKLDPEDLREVMQAYHARAAEIIDSFDGHVAQYLGDGVLAYFGFPQAHEDAAKRGILAAIELQRVLDQLNGTFESRFGIRLVMRAALHTGEVVVGEVIVGPVGAGRHRELQALGTTTIIAARLQELAGNGDVVASDITLRLTGDTFRTEDIGTHALKGINEPIRVQRVLGERGTRDALKVPADHLTPMIGRQRELELLGDRWRRTRRGIGSAVMLSGEPGLGKSRLLRALREQIANESHAWLECQCSVHRKWSAFHPLVQLIEQTAGFDSTAGPDGKLERLAATLPGVDAEGAAEIISLLAPLLSLEAPDPASVRDYSPDVRHKRTVEALATWVLAQAGAEPTMLLVEDLHWSDASTLDCIGSLLEQCPAYPILVVVTFRPDFEPRWRSTTDAARIEVRHLDPAEARSLIDATAGERKLAAAVCDRIVDRADGVPLFIEELTKMIIEGGLNDDAHQMSDESIDRAVPMTLQDSLMARLDRLAGGKEVAQTASVLGREFGYELLRRVSTRDESTLEAGLSALTNAGLLSMGGTATNARYAFRHSLIQDIAYRSMLRPVRRGIHGRTAEALEEDFPELAEAEPEIVARHYDKAEQTGPAVSWHRKAAARAQSKSDSATAIEHLERALALLSTEPANSDRDHLELEILLELTVPLYTTRGWADSAYGAHMTRARDLATMLGEIGHELSAWIGLFLHRQITGELESAVACARRALTLVESRPDPRSQLFPATAVSQTLFLQGKFVPALEWVDAAVVRCNAGRPEDIAERGSEHFLYPYNVLALCYWSTGRPDRALEFARASITAAQKDGPPFDLANAYIYASWILQRRGNHAQALAYAQEAIDLCERLGLAWRPWAMVLRGAVSSPGEQALRDIREGIEALEAKGIRSFVPHCFAALAELLYKLDRPAEAMQAIDRGLATAHRDGQHYEDVELLRMRGEILGASGESAHGAALGVLTEAVETARAQGGKMLELRAITCLARLLIRDGRQGEARSLLRPSYDGFREGFETQDYQLATELLAQLPQNDARAAVIDTNRRH